GTSQTGQARHRRSTTNGAPLEPGGVSIMASTTVDTTTRRRRQTSRQLPVNSRAAGLSTSRPIGAKNLPEPHPDVGDLLHAHGVQHRVLVPFQAMPEAGPPRSFSRAINASIAFWEARTPAGSSRRTPPSSRMSYQARIT